MEMLLELKWFAINSTPASTPNTRGMSPSSKPGIPRVKRKIAKSSSFSFAFVRVFCLLVVDFVLGRGGVVFRLFEEEQEEQQEDHALLRSLRRGGATTDDVREEVGDGVTVIHTSLVVRCFVRDH